ncbi:Tumor necrosis factor receptor superfamily member 14 [Merluccius polli]|uniref:Tumor necrosis factor receptor superfamily member 14 n=1 Tax=Merluccius polli TaxID=89951 RepID=A0AA47N6Q4_MERPO|nr:Tumor necrosis factor receptor superfamily member 14 [Merluccius polli]
MSTCSTGSVVQRDCTEESSTGCVPCERGMSYMDEDNGLHQCRSCQPCKAEQGLVTKRECIKERNSACGVLDSFYCQSFHQDLGCTLAEMHTRCKPGQRTKAPGTNSTDTVCEDCETGFYSRNGIECTKWTM